jgi:hypothetical protein
MYTYTYIHRSQHRIDNIKESRKRLRALFVNEASGWIDQLEIKLNGKGRNSVIRGLESEGGDIVPAVSMEGNNYQQSETFVSELENLGVKDTPRGYPPSSVRVEKKSSVRVEEKPSVRVEEKTSVRVNQAPGGHSTLNLAHGIHIYYLYVYVCI